MEKSTFAENVVKITTETRFRIALVFHHRVFNQQ